jgi:C-terminal processing protease CtpA/Prc
MLIRCDSGAHVRLKVERAHAKLGLGFFYELRSESVAVSRVVPESPAARAGLKKGDVFVEIQGKKVKGMDQGEIKSVINANASTGLSLLVKDDAGERQVEIKAGPIYPGPGDSIPLN